MSRQHSDFLSAYVSTLAPRGEAPERFHFWCGVSTLAAVLRRRVFIDMGTFRWFPNFYIVLVGPPGLVKKSTTIDVGSSMLRELGSINLGADCTTWQQLVTEVAGAQDMFAEAPAADPLDQQHTVTSAITFTISELGTFFDPEDHLMVNVLTELYDCRLDSAWRKATKTQGDDVIMNPFVNILAGTTPDWMRANFRGRFGGWGLSSRMIFLYCDEPDRFIAFPDEQWGDLLSTWRQPFIEDLRHIANLIGRFKLTTAARDFARPWYAEHGRRIVALSRHPHHDPWLSYYLARKFVHVMKLAIVLSVSRSDSLVIDRCDIERAVQRCDEIEGQLSLVFASREVAGREVRLNMDVWRGLESLLCQVGRLDQREAFSFTVSFMTYGRAKELIEHLIASQWLLRCQDADGTWLTFGPNAKRSNSGEVVPFQPREDVVMEK